MRKATRQLPPKLSHQWIELVDLAMHRAIARKIHRDPRLYKRAYRTLVRWEKLRRACRAPLREWKQILHSQGRNRVLRLLTRSGDESQRSRSTAPFCGILTDREVRAIWARYD
jgi:hypothetical protein